MTCGKFLSSQTISVNSAHCRLLRRIFHKKDSYILVDFLLKLKEVNNSRKLRNRSILKQCFQWPQQWQLSSFKLWFMVELLFWCIFNIFQCAMLLKRGNKRCLLQIKNEIVLMQQNIWHCSRRLSPKWTPQINEGEVNLVFLQWL